MVESGYPIDEHPDLRNLGHDLRNCGRYITPELRASAELLSASPELLNLDAVLPGSWISVVTTPEGRESVEYRLYKSYEIVGEGRTANAVWYWMNREDGKGGFAPVEVQPSGACRADGSLAEYDLVVRQGTYMNLMQMVIFRDLPDAPPWMQGMGDKFVAPEQAPTMHGYRSFGGVVEIDGQLYWRMRASLDASGIIGPISGATLL